MQELAPSTPPVPPLPIANLLTGLGIDEYFRRSDSVNGTLTFMTDALGSSLALTNSSGTITTSYTYEPFGKVSVTNPPLLNPNTYQFTGRENDGTGLYFYRARYYSTTFQRFIAQDPTGFAGGDANLYIYVSNRPLSFVDPSGEDVGVISSWPMRSVRVWAWLAPAARSQRTGGITPIRQRLPLGGDRLRSF